MENEKRCLYCNAKLTGKQKKYCSRLCGENIRYGGKSSLELYGVQWSDNDEKWVEVKRVKSPYWITTEELLEMLHPKKPEVEKKIKQPELPKKKEEYLPREGYVYLMWAENGMHKIGISKNVEQRRKNIERDIPVRVNIIHSFRSKDYRAVERNLHQKYSRERIRYEWFLLSQEQVDEIAKITDYELDAFPQITF